MTDKLSQSPEPRLRKWNILDDQIVINLTRAPHDDAEMNRINVALHAFVGALSSRPSPKGAPTVEEIASEAVDAIVTDLRDRRWLKWVFGEPGSADFVQAGVPRIDDETQDEIYSAWRNSIAAILTRFQSGEADGGWRPIETAPRDGTRILAMGGGREPAIFSWDGPSDGSIYSGSKSSYNWATDTGEHVPDVTLTHWRPLPFDPNSSAEAETPAAAETFAHKLLGEFCACYGEAWPAATCATEAKRLADWLVANPVPAVPADGVLEALRTAYAQGCIDTHKAIQAEPELALMPVEAAEFGEAAYDYVRAALALAEGGAK